MIALKYWLRDSPKPDPNSAPRSWAWVRKGGNAAEVREGLAFHEIKIRHYRAGIDKDDPRTSLPGNINCELVLRPSDGLTNRRHWAGPDLFGTAKSALRALGLEGRPGGRGKGVNVVIADHGLSAPALAEAGYPDAYRGGWVSGDAAQPAPGEYTNPYARRPDWHGQMIARNILRVAPEARIYDAPLLPTRIDDVETYTAHAELLFESIQYMVRHAPVAEGPWLIVNAWAVADTASEHGTGSYSARRDHRLNTLVAEMSARDKIGFVFAAGNNGQFGGDSRNGSYDIGPGRSILGANGLPEVLTVGAVRVDGLWIGSSSQGPAPAGLLAAGTGENQKPDLCAPSWFAEDEARDVSNTGTSAAAGLAGGLAALLWSEAPQLTPAELFAIMRAAAARGALLPSWSPRYGHGLAAAPPDLRSWAYA